MAKAVLAAVLLAALLAVASARPCIDCRLCRTNHCKRRCSNNCNNRGVSMNQCKSFGWDLGEDVSSDACDTMKLWCSGGSTSRSFGGFLAASYKTVSLSQCANIAYGKCQERALSRWGSKCGWMMNGWNQCTKADFDKFYGPEVNALCNDAVAAIGA